MFKHYLNRPDATAETFDSHGWFKTGDIAQLDADGYYKILGRNSTDIIKVNITTILLFLLTFVWNHRIISIATFKFLMCYSI